MSEPQHLSVPIGAWLQEHVADWKRYLVFAFVVALLGYGITFVMPRWYRASVVMLPPEEADQGAPSLSLQRLLSQLPSIGSLPTYYSPSDIYRAILTSRSVTEVVAKHFDLQTEYHQKSMERTLKEFRRHLGSEVGADGTISVTVEDHSASRAAAIANALVAELDRFNVERRGSQARGT